MGRQEELSLVRPYMVCRKVAADGGFFHCGFSHGMFVRRCVGTRDVLNMSSQGCQMKGDQMSC